MDTEENINPLNNTDAKIAEGTEQIAAEALDEQPKEAEQKATVASTCYEAISIVVSAIMIITVVFTFCFRLVGVIGPSMLDTLKDGDWLIVTPYYTEPQYGDIIISTKETAADGSIVKRVIAVAGDKVFIDTNGDVYVNDQKLEESSYIRNDGLLHGDRDYPIIVPEGSVMLMGDNRPVSWDSRYTDIGFAEDDYLLGKARFRIAETKTNKRVSISKDMNIYDNFNN